MVGTVTIAEAPETSKTAADPMAAKKKTRIREATRGTIIRSVNPRFHFYDRPLLLALLVASLTILTTVGIFAYLMTGCARSRVRDMSTQTGITAEHDIFFTEKRSVEGRDATTWTSVELCLQAARETISLPHPSYETTLQSPRLNGYVHCLLGPTEMSQFGLTWCGGAAQRDREAAECARINRMTGKMTCRQCGDRQGDGTTNVPSGFEIPYMLALKTSITRTICPDPWQSVGAALGYAVYVELLLTLVFVVLLKACGVLHNVDSDGQSWLNAGVAADHARDSIDLVQDAI